MKIALFALIFSVAAFAQAPDRRTVCRVSGAAMPISQTVPTCMENRTANFNMTGDILVIANTDTVSQTVKVYDGGGTPFKLFDGATIPAKTTWIVPIDGIPLVNGIIWSASATTVQASFVGH